MGKEKGVPQCIEAEKYLLGTILTNSSAIALVTDKLTPGDFYSGTHRLIYEAMLKLYNQNESLDFVMVSEILKHHKETIFEDPEGMHYLIGLDEHATKDFLDPVSHMEEWSNLIVDRSLARKGLQACQIAAQAFMEEPAHVAQAKAEASFAELGRVNSKSDFTPLSQVMEDCVARITSMHDQGGVLVGIPTGFHDLDSLLSGFRDEKLILLAGRPGMGKTSFALTLAHYMAKHADRKVGILSLEMSKDELGDRLIAIDAQIDSRRVSSGLIYDHEWDRFEASSRLLTRLPVAIDDTFGSTLMDLRSKAKRLQATKGLDVLFVDYLQLMDSEDEDARENEVRQLGIISRGLKGLARDLHIPVVALAQLNRSVESRQVKIPQLSDLRGSGNLEQDADIVLFLYREEEYNKETERKGQADLIIAKHRGGPKGVVVLGFEETQTRFYNLMSEEEAQRYE